MFAHLMNIIDTLIKYVCTRAFIKYTCKIDDDFVQSISIIVAICPLVTIPNIRVNTELVIDCVKFVANEISLLEPLPL
jgi:hypothetical protein